MIRARSLAREAALKALYQLDLRGDLSGDDVEALLGVTDLPGDGAQRFAAALVHGVLERREEIDAELSEVALNWKLERMAVIDRNVLRLGTYELLHMPDIPAAVSIDEMVTLAKKYSTKESGAFVNGILDRVHQRHAAQAGAGSEAQE